jgi:hypothetical protein
MTPSADSVCQRQEVLAAFESCDERLARNLLTV